MEPIALAKVVAYLPNSKTFKNYIYLSCYKEVLHNIYGWGGQVKNSTIYTRDISI